MNRGNTKRVFYVVFSLAALSLAIFFVAYTQVFSQAVQAAVREKAVRLELPGLTNFYKVSDQLYRGGQPRKEGMAELKKLGVRTMVNLSSTEKDHEFFKENGINVVHIPITSFFPSRKGYLRFLQVVSDPEQTPVFIHCRHGSDRTGAAVALYRIHIQKWPKEEAIAEMVSGPFGFHRIHSHLKRFVRNFKW